MGEAIVAYLLKDYDRAVEIFDALGMLDKSSFVSCFGRGMSYDKLGRLEDSEMAFKEALQIKPKSLRALNNLGVVRIKQDLLDEALECFDELLSLDQENLLGLYNKAYTFGS